MAPFPQLHGVESSPHVNLELFLLALREPLLKGVQRVEAAAAVKLDVVCFVCNVVLVLHVVVLLLLAIAGKTCRRQPWRDEVSHRIPASCRSTQAGSYDSYVQTVTSDPIIDKLPTTLTLKTRGRYH
jgi:hypothetical protein